jgi:hypothetical protein
MKKNSRFESLKDPKFKTLESRELESVAGGMVASLSLDTITIYSDNTSKNDGQDSWDNAE